MAEYCALTGDTTRQQAIARTWSQLRRVGCRLEYPRQIQVERKFFKSPTPGTMPTQKSGLKDDQNHQWPIEIVPCKQKQCTASLKHGKYTVMRIKSERTCKSGRSGMRVITGRLNMAVRRRAAVQTSACIKESINFEEQCSGPIKHAGTLQCAHLQKEVLQRGQKKQPRNGTARYQCRLFVQR